MTRADSVHFRNIGGARIDRGSCLQNHRLLRGVPL